MLGSRSSYRSLALASHRFFRLDPWVPIETAYKAGIRSCEVLLVGTLGCQRECCEAAVAVGANFCVVAEEADEGDISSN
jgi:hypothetical protein